MSDGIPGSSGDFAAGSRIAGYLLEQEIGRGGMAVVFRARDERLGRLVALKILAPSLAGDDAFRQRFISESRAAAAIDDPHIVPVYEAGESGGVLFIAMRYVPGGDAQSRLRQEGPMSPGRAADVISPVASALDAAHAAGLLHRDVKPSNMLVDSLPGRPDHVYLSDFGLSKAVASTGMTRTGHIVGTLDYISPEQIEGRPADGRCDQYALACSVFELLTGTPPFRRDEPTAVMYAQMSEPPPPLTARRPDLPAAANSVLARALAKAPDDRYASCREFADCLRVALGFRPYDSGPQTAQPPGRLPTEVAWPSASPAPDTTPAPIPRPSPVPAAPPAAAAASGPGQGGSTPSGWTPEMGNAPTYAGGLPTPVPGAAAPGQTPPLPGTPAQGRTPPLPGGPLAAHGYQAPGTYQPAAGYQSPGGYPSPAGYQGVGYPAPGTYQGQAGPPPPRVGYPSPPGGYPPAGYPQQPPAPSRPGRRRRRTWIAVAVAAAVVLVAGLAYGLSQSSGPPPATVAIRASSSLAKVTGYTYVIYHGGDQSHAEISGSVQGATAGEVVRLYARQFPFGSSVAPAGVVSLQPSGKRAHYQFQVTPILATRYTAMVFASQTATTPVGTSPVTTVYVAVGGSSGNSPTCARPVCHLAVTTTNFVPPQALSVEMSKRWYAYFAVSLSPTKQPPAPTTLTLGAGDPVISAPRRVAPNEYTEDITFTFTIGNDGYTWGWSACARDTEPTDGVGLPGSHGCGAEQVPDSNGYLG